MKRPSKLNASFVRTVKQPGRYGDGRGGYGLSLLIKPMISTDRISKSWSQRLRVHGRVTNIGLGSYPLTTLSEAREKAFDNRRTVKKGEDPRRGRGVPTFSEAAEKVIKLYSVNWKDSRDGGSERQWRSSLERFVFPKIGHRRVDEITRSDVREILRPIWTDKRSTADRVRIRLSTIFKWAKSEFYREDNPALPEVSAGLSKKRPQKKHHSALPHGEVADALSKIREAHAAPAIRLCVEFIALTAARSGEGRGATWQEIDLSSATWTIPAERMKTGVEHRVPLSGQAMAVLAKAVEYKDRSGLVFPSTRAAIIQRQTLTGVLRRCDISATIHGFRTSFRSWAADNSVDPAVAEASLAHSNPNRIERAYQRSDLLEQRCEVMQNWAGYIAGRLEN